MNCVSGKAFKYFVLSTYELTILNTLTLDTFTHKLPPHEPVWKRVLTIFKKWCIREVEEMETPGSLYFYCPECGEDTLHHIIRARFSAKKKTTLSGVAECTECGFVHKIELSEEADIETPLVLSEGDSTRKTTIMLAPEEELEHGTELMFGESTIKVTRLEREGVSLKRAQAREIDTIWAKKYDKIPIKVTISRGPHTYSRKVWGTPDEEFEIGDVIRFKEYTAAIKKILTRKGMVNRGFVQARDIVRVYCAVVK